MRNAKSYLVNITMRDHPEVALFVGVNATFTIAPPGAASTILYVFPVKVGERQMARIVNIGNHRK